MSETSTGATLASAAFLNAQSALASDLVILLRQAPANGQPVTYQPVNITLQAMLDTYLPYAIARLGQVLPQVDNSQSPVWNNDGVLTFTSGTIITAPTTASLTPQQFSQSEQAWFKTALVADPGDGVTIWNNDGVPTLSTAAGT